VKAGPGASTPLGRPFSRWVKGNCSRRAQIIKTTSGLNSLATVTPPFESPDVPNSRIHITTLVEVMGARDQIKKKGVRRQSEHDALARAMQMGIATCQPGSSSRRLAGPGTRRCKCNASGSRAREGTTGRDERRCLPALHATHASRCSTERSIE
jgi:hypothetical protein